MGKRFSDADLFERSLLKNALGMNILGGAREVRMARVRVKLCVMQL